MYVCIKKEKSAAYSFFLFEEYLGFLCSSTACPYSGAYGLSSSLVLVSQPTVNPAPALDEIIVRTIFIRNQIFSATLYTYNKY